MLLAQTRKRGSVSLVWRLRASKWSNRQQCANSARMRQKLFATMKKQKLPAGKQPASLQVINFHLILVHFADVVSSAIDYDDAAPAYPEFTGNRGGADFHEHEIGRLTTEMTAPGIASTTMFALRKNIALHKASLLKLTHAAESEAAVTRKTTEGQSH